MKQLGKYSFGVGDRFAHQGVAQLQAIVNAKNEGIEFTPVWNKSNREHQTVNSMPADTRVEADEAVKKLKWEGAYFVDADHINLSNVDNFVEASDFFTLDVADYIGKKATDTQIKEFVEINKKYIGNLQISETETIKITESQIVEIAEKFLFAIKEAGKIYQYLLDKKGEGNFVTEVSMDEVEEAQTPIEMFFILSAIAAENIPAQTIAPKFTGRFNKGVDYVGDISQFRKEFEQDLLVIKFAVKEFGLPQGLKLSVHSGSDKFSIYPIMGELIKKHDTGIHIKTAGTTWLEEVIGLAIAGKKAYELAQNIYIKAYEKIEELSAPYSTVIDIDYNQLPTPEQIKKWTNKQFATALQHEPANPEYNKHFRQLIHVGYKIAAQFGKEYTDALKENAEIVAEQVTFNIYKRHIKRLF